MSRLSLPFRTHMFTLTNMTNVPCAAAGKPYRLHAPAYALIVAMHGAGSAVIDDRRLRVAKGSCFLLPPNSRLEASADNASELRLFVLAFEATPVGAGERSGPSEADALSCSPYAELYAKPFGRLAAMLDELYLHRSPPDELAAFKQHLRLQELLYELYRGHAASYDGMKSREAVRRSIDGLHAPEAVETSVEALARQANIGTRQYTHLFRQLTGWSPLEYRTELRLNEAKKKLLTSNDSLQHIAQSAGFKDVYYFSRRFKQKVGQSPRQYVRRTRQSLRVVALYYANVLLSIGVKPIGANLSWWGGSVFLREMEQGIEDIGYMPSPEAISRLEPDLILMNDSCPVEYADLSRIAPTVMLPYEGGRSIYEDVRLIGALIDKPHAAAELQSRFERRAAAVRERLAGIVGGRTTAAIVRFDREGRRFTVFGDNYGRGGWPIYRGLRLGIPEAVQRDVIGSGLQIVQNLPLHELPTYAGNADYLFVSDEGEGIRHVESSPIWRSLPAVRRERVHVLDRASYGYFDPISIEGQLELLAERLLDRQPASCGGAADSR